MDLASGAQTLIVTMTHRNKDGSSKVVQQVDLPLTAPGAVDILITDLAIFRFRDGRMILTEVMPGRHLEEIRHATSTEYDVELDKLE